MLIGVNCGHTIEGAGSGAVGLFRESEHTRLVGRILMNKLMDIGQNVVNCTVDRAASQEVYLQRAVQIANQAEVELFISIHFNASGEHRAQGVEVYTYKGRKHAEAIFSALCETVVDKKKAVADREERFMDFVGDIAYRDWQERRIMLPSVVVAQAIKESAWGTSELAKNANALFGIKENGWKGKTYIKTATEQREDGSFYTVEGTKWRAYDSWKQSILDHNDYIANRSTDGGRTLRYKPVVGCSDYILAACHLQECGYATAHGYAQSLIYDYIEKYHLTRFDSVRYTLPAKKYMCYTQDI